MYYMHAFVHVHARAYIVSLHDPPQDIFVATVNKTHEKTKEQEEKEGWGWFTPEQMRTELKWSKPGT